ncbi:MAG: hypothetical protein M3323_11655 [Actinomycetota bacterium]|nr:hypothetical protein [Actinomycetota bacterium]
MTKRFRNGILAATTAAAIAVPMMPATPAAAQSHDCTIMGPEYVEEVVDCVYMILSMISRPPLDA